MKSEFLIFLIELFFTTLTVLIAYLIYKDAKKRKMWAILWAYIAIIPVAGWIFYFFMRKPLIEERCPDCSERVNPGDPVCRDCPYNFTVIAEEKGLVKTYASAPFRVKIKAFFTGLKYLLGKNRVYGKDCARKKKNNREE